MGTQSDIRDQRYRTEPDIGTSDIRLNSTESDILSDIGINFCPISDNEICKFRSAVVRSYEHNIKAVSSISVRKYMFSSIFLRSLWNDLSILYIGISDIDLVRYRNES